MYFTRYIVQYVYSYINILKQSKEKVIDIVSSSAWLYLGLFIYTYADGGEKSGNKRHPSDLSKSFSDITRTPKKQRDECMSDKLHIATSTPFEWVRFSSTYHYECTSYPPSGTCDKWRWYQTDSYDSKTLYPGRNRRHRQLGSHQKSSASACQNHQARRDEQWSSPAAGRVEAIRSKTSRSNLRNFQRKTQLIASWISLPG